MSTHPSPSLGTAVKIMTIVIAVLLGIIAGLTAGILAVTVGQGIAGALSWGAAAFMAVTTLALFIAQSMGTLRP
ncbi:MULTISPECIES: hypothetical protein [Streptomyces]|uniref:Uncharacterized protein n=1 Tax=Streptomyces lasalocidi TaxID=324833 RepID=A0A4U5W6C3_STRLS|nr:hypothetical protein [Streptomyces lasalocidi]TKS96140.1 hypothetical protein E4U91_35860 [Streptomyces lasalocidi]